jgi:hypothetical protein
MQGKGTQCGMRHALLLGCCYYFYIGNGVVTLSSEGCKVNW